MKNSNSKYHGHGYSEPIGLEYIAGMLVKAGYNINFQNRLQLDVFVPEINRKISLFTSTSSEWDHVLTLNETARKNGHITIIGGYHIVGVCNYETYTPFDYIVIGEGEEIILNVIADIISNKGIVKKRELPRYFCAKQIQDLDSLPLPVRNRHFLNEYKINDLIWPPSSQQVSTAIMLGSRGCTNNCSFCASSAMWGEGIRLRSPDNIINEIKVLKKEFKTNTLVFVDQNIGQVKKWTKQLCYRIIEENLNVKWYVQTNLTIDRQLIPIMAAAGCTKIGFGIEGISPQAIKKIKLVNKLDLGGNE